MEELQIVPVYVCQQRTVQFVWVCVWGRLADVLVRCVCVCVCVCVCADCNFTHPSETLKPRPAADFTSLFPYRGHTHIRHAAHTDPISCSLFRSHTSITHPHTHTTARTHTHLALVHSFWHISSTLLFALFVPFMAQWRLHLPLLFPPPPPPRLQHCISHETMLPGTNLCSCWSSSAAGPKTLCTVQEMTLSGQREDDRAKATSSLAIYLFFSPYLPFLFIHLFYFFQGIRVELVRRKSMRANKSLLMLQKCIFLTEFLYLFYQSMTNLRRLQQPALRWSVASRL